MPEDEKPYEEKVREFVEGMIERTKPVTDKLAQFDNDTMSARDQLMLAAAMLDNTADGKRSLEALLQPPFAYLLADLLRDQADAVEDHLDGSAVIDRLCAGELHAIAVARSILYPPTPYAGEDAQHAEVDRRYGELATENAKEYRDALREQRAAATELTQLTQEMDLDAQENPDG